MSEKDIDVLVVGEINPDIILSDPNLSINFGQQESVVEKAAFTVGSSSVIFACGAAKLGLKIGFVGICGDDPFGHFMLKKMEEHNVDVSHVIMKEGVQTGFSVILSRKQDRAIFTYLGAITELKVEDISEDLLNKSRHIHIASYFLQEALRPGIPHLFRKAHSLGLTISLDTNWDPVNRWDEINLLLGLVDVFLPNENEALAITHCADISTAIRQLAQGKRIVAVKMGKEGGVVMRGDEIHYARALPVPVEDTVGAGDSFDAGFVYGYLNHWSIEDSVKLACACGSLSTTRAGGVSGQPTFSEALEAMKRT